MCMAYPYEIKKIKGNLAIIDKGEIDLSLVKDLSPGDWILVKDKYAVSRISKKEAKDMVELINKTREAGGSNVC